MHRIWKSLVAAILPASIALAADGRVTDRTKVCMMQDTVMERPGTPIEHEGRTYYGCCALCGKAMTAAPERHTRALDPVSHREVDKATAPIYEFMGRAYYFEGEATLARFAEEPLRFIPIASTSSQVD